MNYYPDRAINVFSDYKVVKDYSCKLHRQDGFPGFYILQLLEEVDRHGVYHVYSRWGREGRVGNQRMSASINILEDAIKGFERRFHARTGVNWHDRDNDVYQGRYRLIDDEEYSSTKKMEPLQEKEHGQKKRRRYETPESEHEEGEEEEEHKEQGKETEESDEEKEKEEYMREVAKNRDRPRQKSTMLSEPAKPKSIKRQPLSETKSPSKQAQLSDRDNIKQEKYCQILRDLCFETNILQELDPKLISQEDKQKLVKQLTDEFYKEVSHIFEGKKKPLIDNNEACIKVLHEVLAYKKNESKENK